MATLEGDLEGNLGVAPPLSLPDALNFASRDSVLVTLRAAGVTNRHLLDWYKENLELSTLLRTTDYAYSQGYTFDPGSGLFIRYPFSEEDIVRIGRTIVDVIFLRPSDLHYHKDVDEVIRFRGGEGWWLKGLNRRILKDENSNMADLYVPSCAVHQFISKRGSHLELEVVCSGILNPAEEVCVMPFHEYDPENLPESC